VLRDDVEGVGHRGDVVDVSEGYGRNFLVPKGLAIVATPGIQAQAEAMRSARLRRDARDRVAAEEVAVKLAGRPVTVTRRAGEGGRLFGSVTSTDIAEAVAGQLGFEIDRKRVQVDEPIREVGSHTVIVKLHADVQVPITVEVTAQA